MDDLGRLGTILGWSLVIFAIVYIASHWVGLLPDLGRYMP